MTVGRRGGAVPGRPMARGIPSLGDLAPCASTGVGSLPHRSAGEAARFALTEYDVPAIPALPRRSPAESMIVQAVVGIDGVTPGQYGSLAVDCRRVDPCRPVVTDLGTDAFRGMRAFLHAAKDAGFDGPVKWQFVGPVTLGVALTRAGLTDDDLAFAVATRAVRSHVSAIAAAIATALPHSPQIVVLDEPWLGELTNPDFPIPPDRAIDHLSTAMASVSGVATVGVHCCAAHADTASLLAAGPDLLSVPARHDLVDVAGYLSAFLADGGRIAWGVVPTDGPLSFSVERSWRCLAALWDELAARGVDAELLRDRSLVTPDCGLGLHTPVVAEQVCRTSREIGKRAATWIGPRSPA